jgi:hypothetical protein
LTAPESAVIPTTPYQPRPPAGPEFPQRSALALVRDRRRTYGLFRLGVVLVGVIVGAAALAPWLPSHSLVIGDLENADLVQPGGRSVAVTLLLGLVVGCYLRGVDGVVMRHLL